MMKKISLLFLLSFFTAISFADEVIEVNLNDFDCKDSTITAVNGCIKIDFKLVNEKVNIILKNTDRNQEVLTYCLFNKEYDKKQLKKNNIKFNKALVQITNARVKSSSDFVDEIILLKSDEDIQKSTAIEDNIPKTKSLYIYIGKEKKKNFLFWSSKKTILYEQIKVDIKITADLNYKKEQEKKEKYNDFRDRYNELEKEFNGLKFCNNPRHKPSLAQQKEEFKEKVYNLMKEISNYIGATTDDTSEFLTLNNELNSKLDEKTLKEKEHDCGKHKIFHSCRYCNSSLLQIYRQLDEVYKKIYNSQNRSEAKSEYLRNVKAMYDCAKRRKDWGSSDYKEKIERYYKEISRF